MTKILMVCLGNICRSPLAEGILQNKLNQDFIVDSCGTANYHINQSPDERSILVAKNHNIDISNHLGRQFSPIDFTTYDLIYVMDSSNYQDIIQLANTSEEKEKVKLILDELPESNLKNVPDPYYSGQSDFDACYQLLDEVCAYISEKLLK